MPDLRLLPSGFAKRLFSLPQGRKASLRGLPLGGREFCLQSRVIYFYYARGHTRAMLLQRHGKSRNPQGQRAALTEPKL